VIEAVAAWMQQLYEALAAVGQLSLWTYLLVAAGGLASGISPCYVPVLAMFGGYVGGYAPERRGGGLRLAVPFVLGNAVTLAVTGGIAALIGKSALAVFNGQELDRWIPGAVGLLMGLQLLGVLNLKMPAWPIFRWARQPGTGLSAFALGLPFGVVVTPCTMPIFFAIVAFVAFQQSVLHGTLLMVAYALGRGLILLAVATSVGFLKALNIGQTSRYIEYFSGAVVLAASVGLLAFYDDFVRFTMQLMPTGQ